MPLAALFAGATAMAPVPEDHKKSALIIVDTQNCFTNGPREGVDDIFDICNPPATGGTDTCTRTGSLGVATGQSIVPNINKIRTEAGCMFDMVLRSQDYHPAGHISWASTHFENPFFFSGGPLPYVGYAINMHCTKADSLKIMDGECCLVDTEQPACTALDATLGACTRNTDPNNVACVQCALDPDSCIVMPQGMWTDHCAQDGDSEFADGLLTPDTDIVLQKGIHANIDAYSIFMDNAKIHKTYLDDILKAAGIERLFVTGIARDYCVAWTATDGVDLGYEVYVIEDATAPIGTPIDETTTSVDLAMADFAAKGVQVISTDDMLAMSCPIASSRRKLHQERGRVIQLS